MIYGYNKAWTAAGLLLFVLFMVAQSLSCAHSFSKRDRWEGIRHDKLRVCVQFFMPENAVDILTDKILMDELLMAGKKRAWLLINSHVQNKTSSVEILYQLKNKFDILLMNGSIIYNSCGEENCVAYLDFMLDKSLLDMFDK